VRKIILFFFDNVALRVIATKDVGYEEMGKNVLAGGGF